MGGGGESHETRLLFFLSRKCSERLIFWTVLKMILIGKLFQGCRLVLLCTENKVSQKQFQ